MNAVKKWVLAVRAPFFTGIAMPVIFGATLGYYETGTFHWGLFLITLFGGICAHAGANLANDYFDHKTTDDDINPNFTPFSGGSRMIQNKILSARSVLTASLFCYALALGAGIYLMTKTPGYWVLILAGAGFSGRFLLHGQPIGIFIQRFGGDCHIDQFRDSSDAWVIFCADRAFQLVGILDVFSDRILDHGYFIYQPIS